MAPGYQGRIEDDESLPNKHNALSGDEFEAGIESENPEEDRGIKKEILRKLSEHPVLDISEVEVNVKGGFVSITGKAENIDAKSTIEALVAKTDGVIDVVNFLQLRKGLESGDGQGIQNISI